MRKALSFGAREKILLYRVQTTARQENSSQGSRQRIKAQGTIGITDLPRLPDQERTAGQNLLLFQLQTDRQLEKAPYIGGTGANSPGKKQKCSQARRPRMHDQCEPGEKRHPVHDRGIPGRDR
jgi:hypothetical protein